MSASFQSPQLCPWVKTDPVKPTKTMKANETVNFHKSWRICKILVSLAQFH
jgi:hypothetical protein